MQATKFNNKLFKDIMVATGKDSGEVDGESDEAKQLREKKSKLKKKEMLVVVKSDSVASVDALIDAFEELELMDDESVVNVRVVSSGVGDVGAIDVVMASVEAPDMMLQSREAEINEVAKVSERSCFGSCFVMDNPLAQKICA